MQEHLAEKVALEDMAAVAYMSTFHYLRVFQRMTGVPPSRFLGALRLEASKRLLVNTNSAVFDICQDVGYSSLGTFGTRFSKLVGLAPARFRSIYHELLNGHPGSFSLPPQPRACGVRVHGSIEHELGDNVAVFVGLFKSRIPQELPLACDMLLGVRDFRLIAPIGDEPYYVLTVALRQVTDLALMFDNRSLIAGVGASGPLSTNGSEQQLTLRLRQADLLDPPILVAFPLLMHMKHDSLSTRAASSMLASRPFGSGGGSEIAIAQALST